MIDAFTDEDFRISCLIEDELDCVRRTSQLNEKVKFWHNRSRGLWVSPGNPESMMPNLSKKFTTSGQILTDVTIGPDYYEGHICLDSNDAFWNRRYTITLQLVGDVVVNTQEKVTNAEFLHLTPEGAWAYKVSYESDTRKPSRGHIVGQYQAV